MVRPFKKIDFFIIGAPKAGTDSMREWLSQCKRTFVYGPKEPNYFCSDILAKKKFEGFWSAWIVLSGIGSKYIGEKSTWYLGSKVAARKIKEYNSEAKIIIMTRPHLDLFKSLHGELLKLGVETVSDPICAWQQTRRKSAQLAFNNTFIGNYHESCRIGAQAAHWLSEFGHNQTIMMEIDDLADARRRAALARFLNIKHFPQTKAQVRNVRKLPIQTKLKPSVVKDIEGEIVEYFSSDRILLDQLKAQNRKIHEA